MIIGDKDKQVIQKAKDILEELLGKIGVESSVALRENTEKEEEPPTITFNIEGDDLGILIGRRGQTLSCLQFILRLMVGHQTKTWLPIIVDVEGYKQNRSEKLRALAFRLAGQVVASKKPFTLEPMPAYERRIIHIALLEDPDITTESIGLGEARKVIIRPK